MSTKYKQNFEFSKTAEFTDWMISAIRVTFARVVRVHVSGDYYDVPYTRRWREIVKALPNVQFFAYTRSWRDEAIFPELVALGALPNFQLWWSTDRETGPAPLVRGVRQAYMAINDTDAMFAPNDSDLIFRDKRDTPLTQVGGMPVCPAEDGIKRDKKITCYCCGLCWDRAGQVKTLWETRLHTVFSGSVLEISV